MVCHSKALVNNWLFLNLKQNYDSNFKFQISNFKFQISNFKFGLLKFQNQLSLSVYVCHSLLPAGKDPACLLLSNFKVDLNWYDNHFLLWKLISFQITNFKFQIWFIKILKLTIIVSLHLPVIVTSWKRLMFIWSPRGSQGIKSRD